MWDNTSAARLMRVSWRSEEVGRQREAVRQLQEELNSVKKGLLTLHAAMWRSQQHERAQHAQHPQQQQQQAAPISEASQSHAPAPPSSVPGLAQQHTVPQHNMQQHSAGAQH